MASGLTRPAARATRMNGLNAEPGWRWPLVARLNGFCSKSVPPTIAFTSPVLFSIATSDALGPTPASRPLIACSAAAWSSGSSVVVTLSPPLNTARGLVAVHELLGQPAREVGLVGVRLRRVDLVLGREGVVDRVGVLALR